MLKPTLEQQNLLVQAEHYELFIDPDMEGDRGYAVRVDRINNNTVSFSLSWGVE
ncbi:hypothetical protein VST7929_03303 [Vibrio stylophorae]|nr:hypothetical protein [Vibrio stylophorae]CAH0536282.1 hypothetical protein VST7929_03303 [Vibrio stylophorae]